MDFFSGNYFIITDYVPTDIYPVQYGEQQYLTTAKINAAAQYLKNTDISVTGAAQSVGYTDYRVFNKAFRRHFNASPSEWRKKHIRRQSFIENQ